MPDYWASRVKLFMSLSFFHYYYSSDTFILELKTVSSGWIVVNMTYKNIAWKSDRDTKFRNPPGNLTAAFRNYAKPRNWPKPVYELDPAHPDNNGFLNQDFIVWMRTSAFSTFRKLYRIVDHSARKELKDGLPKGTYRLRINYSILCKGELSSWS